MADIDLLPLLLVCPAIILLVWLARAFRWQICLKCVGQDQPFRRTYLVTGSALGLAVITPVQSGEAAKLLDLPSGTRRVQAAGLFALERMADFALLAMIAAIGAIWASLDVRWMEIAALIGGAGLVGLIALSTLRHRLPLVSDAVQGISLLLRDPASLLGFAATSVAAWVGTLLLWWVAIHASGVDLPPGTLCLVVGVATFANIISIIPGAIGVSEAGIAALLVFSGVAPATSVVAALAIRVTGLQILALGALHYGVLGRGRPLRQRRDAA